MFVAFEGIDGSGKTTVSKMVGDALREKGYHVYITKEPTENIQWTEEMKHSRDPASGFSLFFRFTEDRYVHQAEIARQLESGRIVLSDRYLLSSLAYQGAIIESAFPGRKEALKWMMDTSSIIKVRPELTFYLDVDPYVSMDRLSRRASLSGFEESEYLNRVRELYKSVDFEGKITIDASQEKEKVFSEILERIEHALMQ